MSASQLLFPLIVLAFTVWMLVDAIRRQANILWLTLIVLGAPYGGLIYFFVVKLPKTDVGRRLLGRPPEASDAQAPAPEQEHDAPYVEPAAQLQGPRALDVADKLEARGRYNEALLVYRRALARDPRNAQALHGQARCEAETGHLEASLESYASLMEIDPRFRDYSAALEYAETLHRAERDQDAVDLLAGLAQETERLNHRLALAHYLEGAGQVARARSVLSEARAAYEGAPESQRVADRKWYRLISDKLEDLSAADSAH